MPRYALIALSLLAALPALAWAAEPAPFVGGLEEDRAQIEAAPIPVRNDVAQTGDPIVTKRYFKIKKGSFPEFLEVSQQGVWPFFEKIGSRVIGMWQVIHPAEADKASPAAAGDDNHDYDEVYLMTQYASVAHWKASRKMAEMGGNGPDWAKAREALALRASLTLATRLEFLRGSTWKNPPHYMPGLGERYIEAP
jgi:hypothetical protein